MAGGLKTFDIESRDEKPEPDVLMESEKEMAVLGDASHGGGLHSVYGCERSKEIVSGE